MKSLFPNIEISVLLYRYISHWSSLCNIVLFCRPKWIKIGNIDYQFHSLIVLGSDGILPSFGFITKLYQLTRKPVARVTNIRQLVYMNITIVMFCWKIWTLQIVFSHCWILLIVQFYIYITPFHKLTTLLIYVLNGVLKEIINNCHDVN